MKLRNTTTTISYSWVPILGFSWSQRQIWKRTTLHSELREVVHGGGLYLRKLKSPGLQLVERGLGQENAGRSGMSLPGIP